MRMKQQPGSRTDLPVSGPESVSNWISWMILFLFMGLGIGMAAEISHSDESKPVTVRTIALDLEYVAECRIRHHIHDGLTHKTLVVDFNRPMTVLSTLDGWRTGIRTVGNHYAPLEFWAVGHGDDLNQLQNWIPAILEKQPVSASFLFTGADMDHVSVQMRHFRDMTVLALVTAGVCDNAQRSGRDTGNYYEGGTINILLLTNRLLSPGAMSRALITATEAKTAALQDLDIRSSYSPLAHQATGTGTDNILVVQGDGPSVDSTGGHTKMGELMAQAVYAGVREAIQGQDTIEIERGVIHRLAERKIDMLRVIESASRLPGRQAEEMLSRFHRLMDDPGYAGFVMISLAISDAVESGQKIDLLRYQDWCRSIAGAIAGKPVDRVPAAIGTKDMPPVIRMAIDALLCGLYPEAVSRPSVFDVDRIAAQYEQWFWK